MNLNRLKGLMAEKGVTRSELAKILNISLKTLSLKINGKTSFKVNELILICDYFNVKPDFFLSI